MISVLRVSEENATVGVADHCGWAILVTVSKDSKLIDRRLIKLVDDDLPKLPHHHEAQSLSPPEAEALIEKVRSSSREHAARRVDELIQAIPMAIQAFAIRECPAIPENLQECLANYGAQNVADSIMYRKALAEAAQSRGIAVHWYKRKTVFSEAEAAVPCQTIERFLKQIGSAIGPPWQKDHKTAMAAAMAVSLAQARSKD